MLGPLSKKLLLKVSGGVDSKVLIAARSTSRCVSAAYATASDLNQDAEKLGKDSAFTVSYLVDSCGFTHEAATAAAAKFSLKSAEKPDKVLGLLRDYGFAGGDISRLLQHRPELIVTDPELTLRPKLDLLASLGPTQELLVKVVLRCPEILQKSREKSLVPSLEFLRSMLHTDENVLKAMSRCNRLLWFKLPVLLGPNVEFLREVGMPDNLISAFLKDRPSAFLASAARLRVLVDRARQMGFDPKRRGFVEAVSAFAGMSDKTWERKVEVFKKWGWSDDELVSAFKKFPLCMTSSEKKVDAVMDYLVNTMKLDPSFVARTSKLVTLSLEKRIIPRCSIIHWLLSKGVLLMQDVNLSNALTVSEDSFLRTFVTKYVETLPELLDLYNQYKNGATAGIFRSVQGHDISKPSIKMKKSVASKILVADM
uniref:Uncharacterized protein n=1 Tax=Kalanchoe fedtschenkoi TaxID=63787 RepID=A0A7N0U2E1_KALFE